MDMLATSCCLEETDVRKKILMLEHLQWFQVEIYWGNPKPPFIEAKKIQ